MRHAIDSNQKIDKFSVFTYNNLIENMISELNANFIPELGSATVAEQFAATVDNELENPFSQTKLIFEGGSHAGRLAAAADNAGINTANLSQPGFNIRVSTKVLFLLLTKSKFRQNYSLILSKFRRRNRNSDFGVAIGIPI
jgi:hypothetical protein